MEHRDTIVIGSSAGGVEAVPQIISALPKDLPAAVLVVQHMAESTNPMFAQIIGRTSQLPVRWAEQGDRIDPGQVYVTPPGVHMMIIDDHLQLTAGARENHVRPSIDRVFRSAAALRAGRTIGVLLTGMLDDGVAGLHALKKAGGYTIVQDPEDAQFPDLPQRALAAFKPDQVLTANAIGVFLVRATRELANTTTVPAIVAAEASLDREEPADPKRMPALGAQSPISCPDCHGPTWHIAESPPRYRCYLGHVATARRVIDASHGHVEIAMWSAIRSLHERSMTYADLAVTAQRQGHDQIHAIYLKKAEVARSQAETARKFMLELALAPE